MNEDGDVYSNKFRIDNIDLVSVSKTSYNDNEKLIRWCRILHAHTRDEIVKELGDVLMDKESREKLLEEVERNSRDEDLYELHEAASREEMERRTELVEALQQNTKEVTEKVTEEVTQKVTEQVKKQSQIETAKKMLKENLSLDLICKITGLSKEEVGNIKKS